jgi:hypothetical protein
MEAYLWRWWSGDSRPINAGDCGFVLFPVSSKILDVRAIRAAKIIVLGFGLYGLSVAWIFVWDWWQRKHDPPGWIVDRSIPIGPQILASIAVLLVVAGTVVWITRFAANRIRRTTPKPSK